MIKVFQLLKFHVLQYDYVMLISSFHKIKFVHKMFSEECRGSDKRECPDRFLCVQKQCEFGDSCAGKCVADDKGNYKYIHNSEVS